MPDPNRRQPGMPPMGMEKLGPVGARVVSPEKAQAIEAMAAQAAQATETPPPVPPETPPAEEKDDVLPPKKDAFAQLQDTIRENPYGIKDVEFARRMSYLDSEDRRKKIEARCEPLELDFTDYVLRGEWRQKVPIWGKDRPVVELRSTHVDDELIIREYQAGRYSGTNNADLTLALLTVAASVAKIGDKEFPILPSGDCDYEARKKIFAECLKYAKMSWVMLWDIYINVLWFQGRIRRATYGADAPF